MATDFSVLLISSVRWSSVTRLALTFLEEEVKVHTVCPRGHSLHCLKKIATFRPYPVFQAVPVLANIISELKPDLVIPADDRSVLDLHQVHQLADIKTDKKKICREILENSLGNPSAFSLVETRLKLIKVLRAEGISTPKAANMKSLDDVKTWCAHTPGPWVLKRDRSWGGSGVAIADTYAEMENAFTRLSNPVRSKSALRLLLADRDAHSFLDATLLRQPLPVMAQAHVEGSPANIMVACWQGKVLDTRAVNVLAHQGRTGAATIVEITQSDAMEHAARITCQKLGLSGFFGLDFMRCARTGTYHFIELNPRLTQIGHLSHKGSTLAHSLLHHIRKNTRPAFSGTPDPTVIALFPQILRAGMQSQSTIPAFIDIPWKYPELVEELLQRPWSRRGYIARLEERFRRNIPYGKSLEKHEAMACLSTLARYGMTNFSPIATLT
ncbi:ATP-grasp domain-containing protein [Acetobacter estunensis]|uniref:ATP-grasp domain-containing protein n=1 Tax=Acetobacter estunensis TaxID=104097 RepID=UPI001C2D2278|nr:ATP-grasp domain-containing protein [Acetobacter estunensis]MBV1837458.1 ATP-grasp domain-containing protein [Acetobacter estunensis]